MANNYGLFFRRDDQLIRLPYNPEKLPVARSLSSEEYNVLGLGQIIVPRARDLRQVTISCFFPGRPFPGVLTSGGFQPPEFYISFFESAMVDQVPILYTPVRYYENGEQFMAGDLGFPVLVTQFDTEERGGETGDFYYTLELTEYREFAPQTIQLPSPGAAASESARAEPVRSVPNGQLCVGSVCVANGPWYYSSYGDEPHGNGNGRRVVVSRIVDETRKCPVHVVTESGGALGWMSRESLRVENGTAPVKVAQSGAAAAGASGGKKAQTSTVSRETLTFKETRLDPGEPQQTKTTKAVFTPNQASPFGFGYGPLPILTIKKPVSAERNQILFGAAHANLPNKKKL